MTPGDQNYEYTIVIATDAYGISINNSDIRLNIQWDIPTTLDIMIQRLGKADRDSNQSFFVLIIPK